MERNELDMLLDLHGEIVFQENGYWIKVEAWTVKPSDEVPHGIRYSLTLHDNHNQRVLGFDNAHAVELPRRKRYSCRRVSAWDHKHRHLHDKGTPYKFDSPAQLLADFFAAVDEILGRKQ